jgi:hypothetical protein
MFSSTPLTKTGEAAEETGTVKAEAQATAFNPTPDTSASTDNPDSVVTKVAKADQTALKNPPRRSRAFAIAASAAVLIAVAAVVYTFTNTTPPTPLKQESIQSTPTGNTDNQSNTQVPETANQLPAIPETAPQATPPQATAPTRQPTKVIIKSGPMHKPESVVVEEDDTQPPDPPEPVERPGQRRIPRQIFRPGNPQFEEAMRIAEERRRAAQDARRAAQEQKRAIMLREMQRRRQRRQPLRDPNY